ncbi:hypothetical protein CSQ85_12240 [Bifidobacterium rousetti]|uniref:hypothetical protein n=1 Tax=Bifidobacterium rousetti TaxID=2045439 RepID=UPI001239EA37|nr:hypothetical protein [Bifidobacterium rousetti]KAA8815691.1 hypothetical protein CSQ85_12240 [Bifidobacterium rousetti]
MTTNTISTNSVERILTAYGWTWTKDGNGRITEIETSSPLGEDIPIDIPETTSVWDEVCDRAETYDPDRHATDLIRNPMPGQPTGVRQLIDDAEEIGRMLHTLDQAFHRAIRYGTRAGDRTDTEITGPDCERLRTEVTGYITAYWQQACDGHPYYAFQHDGKTARDMALDYMHERYKDYLNDLEAQTPGILDTFADQSPEPPQADDGTHRAMEAFDRMFDRLWPDPTATGKVLAALDETIERHDQDYGGYDYTIDPNDLDVMALELANALH